MSVNWVLRVVAAAVMAPALQVLWLAGPPPGNAPQAAAPSTPSSRRVNVPYLTGAPFTPTVFWFGKVDQTSNSIDVRANYYNEELQFYIHIIDRRLWYDTSPTAPELGDWDAVSIYLNTAGNASAAPSLDSYRLEIQLWNNFKTAYRGNGAQWTAAAVPITSYTEWRGAAGPNSNADSEGWVAYFKIPFTSLGLATAPPQGTQWGLAVVVHDRDDAQGSIRQDNLWPETMQLDAPSTWGQLVFGLPAYAPPAAAPAGTATIRRGLNGANVVDGAVGGYTTCGNNGADKWTTWGSHNYSSPSVNYQFNIQNQWDISDWPCFSKFYITFPLGSIPAGQTILSASLTMTLRGTAGGGPYGPPPPSYIVALTVDKDWDPATLTWNNAPLASENLGGTWVQPVNGEYSWDVSRAVAQAYSAGGPLRLALYSIDGDYHTGKYFYSSTTTDWNGTVRPTLTVVYGKLCTAPGIDCSFAYFPLISR